MIPFKQKTKGVVKYTAVLIILLCISENCFGLLQRSQKIENLQLFNEYQRQTSPKAESRNSVSYERTLEISPYIRDVRADSRQSRIDAQDIRTDFREIRTELEGITNLKRSQPTVKRLKARDGIDRREVNSVATEETREQTVENTKDSRDNNNYSRHQLRQLSEESVRHFRNEPRISAKQRREHGLRRENSRRSSLYSMETRRVEDIGKSPRSRKVPLNERQNNRESLAFNRYRQPSGKSLQIRKQEETSQREINYIRHNNIRLHKMPVRDIRNEYNNRDNSAGFAERLYRSDESTNRQNMRQNDNLKNGFPRERRNTRIIDALNNKERVENRFNSYRIARREPDISRVRSEPLERRNKIALSRRLSERNRDTEPFQNMREYANSRDYLKIVSDSRVPKEFREDKRNIARDSIDRRNVRTISRNRLIGRHAEEVSEQIQNRENRDLYEQRQIGITRRNFQTLKTREDNEILSRNTQNIVEDRRTQPNTIRLSQRLQRRQNNRQNDQRVQDGSINILERRDNIRLNQEHTSNYNRDRNTNRHTISENNYLQRDMSRRASSYSQNNNYRFDRSQLVDSRSDWTRTLRSQEEPMKNVREGMLGRVQEQRQNRNSASEEPRLYQNHRVINDRQRGDRKRTFENIQYRQELHQERADTHTSLERKSSRMIREHGRANNQYRREHAERRQDVRNIADKRNNSATFSMGDPGDLTVEFARKLKDNSNTLINIIQTILIISLIGQVLKNTSKSKLRSINWQSFFAKEKVF